VVQDLEFRTDTIRFRKEKYYSPGHKQTYLAELPAGYQGQFGPGVRAWVLALYFGGRMSEPKILEVLHTVGMSISAGQLSDLLIKDQEPFHAESAVGRLGSKAPRGSTSTAQGRGSMGTISTVMCCVTRSIRPTAPPLLKIG
jgi:hypothetical protein